MRYVFLALTLLMSSAGLTFTPTCTIKATYSQNIWPGRLVTVTPDAQCPQGGTAYVRFRSQYGTQPDSPPGFFTLKRGQQITRRVPWDWWVEQRLKGLIWSPAPIRKAGT